MFSLLSKRKRILFQFTPLREGRRRKRIRQEPPLYFNSRPSARGDVRTWSNWDGTSISIHAPPRGATATDCADGDAIRHFNSRPSARGDAPMITHSSEPKDFNSRPSARGDLCAGNGVPRSCYFNSRPSARGDEKFFYHRYILINFNSRPSARGDG